MSEYAQRMRALAESAQEMQRDLTEAIRCAAEYMQAKGRAFGGAQPEPDPLPPEKQELLKFWLGLE